MLKYILRFLHVSFFVKIGKVAEQAVAEVRALSPPNNVLLLAAWLAENSEDRQGLLRAGSLRCVGNLTKILFSPFDIRRSRFSMREAVAPPASSGETNIRSRTY